MRMLLLGAALGLVLVGCSTEKGGDGHSLLNGGKKAGTEIVSAGPALGWDQFWKALTMQRDAGYYRFLGTAEPAESIRLHPTDDSLRAQVYLALREEGTYTLRYDEIRLTGKGSTSGYEYLWGTVLDGTWSYDNERIELAGLAQGVGIHGPEAKGYVRIRFERTIHSGNLVGTDVTLRLLRSARPPYMGSRQ